MKLSNRPNSISDARYETARHQILSRQLDEFEEAHDGSGRSEEMPSDLQRRHTAELSGIQLDRDRMSIMEWMRVYGSPSP